LFSVSDRSKLKISDQELLKIYPVESDL